MPPNYYAILGIPPTATGEEIRRAYRKAAFALHPDRGGSDRLMQRINEAWDILGDNNKRRAYDMGRAEPPSVAKPSSAARAKTVHKRAARSPGSAPRVPSFAHIAGSILGAALKKINGLMGPPPSAPKKSRPAATIILCRFCGQKLRVKRGADRIRCPKCHHSDLLN